MLLFVVCCFLTKSTFSKNSFRNTISVSNSLDPDQAQHSVGPDLGPNCLQKLSADDTSRQRVKFFSITNNYGNSLSINAAGLHTHTFLLQSIIRAAFTTKKHQFAFKTEINVMYFGAVFCNLFILPERHSTGVISWFKSLHAGYFCMPFCRQLIFQNQHFLKNNFSSGLIWVQTVCSIHQTTKEVNCRQIVNAQLSKC